MGLTKLDIVRACEGQPLTIWFVGAFRGFKSGSASRYTSAAHYRNFGIFKEDANGRLRTEKMEFSRHHSKISAILSTSGELLYGQYCGKCKAPVPKSWGNCHRCCSQIRKPLPETLARLEKLVARRAGQPAQSNDTAQSLSAELATLSAQVPELSASETTNAQLVEGARKLMEAAREMLARASAGDVTEENVIREDVAA